MFTRSINRLSLTSNIADELFPNIYGDSFYDDISFVATLRALIGSRIAKDDFLRLSVVNRSYREAFLNDYTDEVKIRQLTEEIDSNRILIHGISGSKNTIDTLFSVLDSTFVQVVHPHYIELGDLRMFVAKQAKMRFYINEQNKSVVVFVENLNHRLYHYIQSLISRLVPWYFKDNPLTEEERNLVKSLILNQSTTYVSLIENFASKYDFRSKKIENMLKGFETMARRRRLDTVQYDIGRNEQNIRRNVEQYQSYISHRERLMVEKAGLLALINDVSNDSEMAEYFICNKHLEPISVDNSSLEFIVNCHLENFDPEMYERLARNRDGYIYTGYHIGNNIFVSAEVRKKFLDAIFSDEPLLNVKMCAYYRIDLSGSVETESNYSYPEECMDRIPNPHLQRYSCLGQQKPLIEEYLRNGNNIGAVEQCVCSAKSINIGEDVTFRPFLEILFSSDCKKVIELPDGTSCTPTEALKWLELNESTTEV